MGCCASADLKAEEFLAEFEFTPVPGASEAAIDPDLDVDDSEILARLEAEKVIIHTRPVCCNNVAQPHEYPHRTHHEGRGGGRGGLRSG